MADWNWRVDHPRLHEFVVDELDAFLTTPNMIEKILAGADRMVELRDEQAKREQEFAQQKREYIETEVAASSYLLDFYQQQEPYFDETHTWSDHKWRVTEGELKAVEAGPLKRFLYKYGDKYEVKVSCWVPKHLHKRDIAQDFLLPPPLPYSQWKVTRPRTPLENLMGLALVHDSHGVIARIIPPRHDVWERRDNPIWYFGRERTNKIANNDLVPDLKSIMRRVV